MNIDSKNIRVFPTTLRESVDPAAKFTTEYNLTSLINKLLDRKAFVITESVSPSDTNISELDFNIMGYFFSVKNLDISGLIPETENKNGYINASIKVKYQPYTQSSSQATDDTIFCNWSQLQSSGNEKVAESSTMYTGVEFSFSTTSTLDDSSKHGISSENKSTQANPNTYSYTFTVLEVSDNGTKISIPDASKIRFQTDMSNHHSLAIDDGDLD